MVHHTVHNIAKGREPICETLPRDLRGPSSRNEGLHTQVACMVHGMVQNQVQKDLVHNTAKGRKSICEALPCNLRELISRDEEFHAEVARKIHGMVQNKVPLDLVRSIVQDEPLDIAKVDPFRVTGSVLAPGGLEPPC